MAAKNAADPRRPIDPGLWARAEKLARMYRLVIEPEPSVGYFGRSIELPTVMADGRTVTACVNSLIEATTLTIVSMMEHGQSPPQPALRDVRDQQLNIRISSEERLRLESLAETAGFSSVSDYVRSAALRAAG